jgi:NhaA family Na+:H+ antiporter
MDNNKPNRKRRSFQSEEVRFDRLLLPFRLFIKAEMTAGILLLVSTIVALAWVNSSWGQSYKEFWEVPFSLTFGDWILTEPLLLWINDGLMAMFFFVVGLEIKRELLVGELSSPRGAALPIAAAIGGMLVPALIYVLINAGTPAARGWGIPMATDIAFALGVLVLLGDRAPPALKIFLAALAIADDLGAVLVIALFYTSQISWTNLAMGLLFLLALVVANRFGVRSPMVYGVLGIGGLWLAFLLSGVHPTIAGILAAMTIPARSRINPDEFLSTTRRAIDRFEHSGAQGEDVLVNKDRQAALLELRMAYEQSTTPLQRLEKALHPWISVVVLPIFALANAGVEITGNFFALLAQPITLGIILGLVLGKQVGITLFSWIAVRLGLASLPRGVTWRHIYGVAWLGGIGFTMSLFISGLAFDNAAAMAEAKTGILTASLIAGCIGVLILWRRKPHGSQAP